MNSNPDILTDILGYDGGDVEFEKVTNNLDDHDVDVGVEVIFNYYRKHGEAIYGGSR